MRASWTPIAAESSVVHGAGVRLSSANSRGRSDGSAATRRIHALTPSAYASKRARRRAGRRRSWDRSSARV